MQFPINLLGPRYEKQSRYKFVRAHYQATSAYLDSKVYLEPQTTIKKWMFGETTISYVKIGNHPIETTIYKWLFGVPGTNVKDLRGFPVLFPGCCPEFLKKETTGYLQNLWKHQRKAPSKLETGLQTKNHYPP